MDTTKVLDDLIEAAASAKSHWEVWWVLASGGDNAKHAKIEKHSEYFRVAYNAHYIAIFICFAKLFDTQPKTSSIFSYLKEISAHTDSSEMKELWREYSAIENAARPLIQIRHRSIAHTNAYLKESDVFSPLNITWFDIRDRIFKSCEFVERIAIPARTVGIGYSGIPRTDYYTKATHNMLDAL
jgi:hypothetical protein